MIDWHGVHEVIRVTAWIAVAAMLLVLLIAMAASGGPQRNWSPDAYKPPAQRTYYQPLTCWDGEGQTLVCQRPYVPPAHPVK